MVQPGMLQIQRHLLVLILHIQIIKAVPVNVALRKPIEARLTCGSRGAEIFYSHNDVYVSPYDRVEHECENTTSYPAEHMLDGDQNTWWQSASRQTITSMDWNENDPEAVINIDLQQVFDVESISIKMQASRRPESLIVLKSEDGNNFSPWVIKVTESFQCVTLFQTRFIQSPETHTSVVCDLYTIPNMLDTNEEIAFDFDDVPDSLSSWRSARYLEIQFYKMDLTLGPNADRFHHFTVGEIEVMAECKCSGLHIGCEKSVVSGQYECVCGGNTQGEHCEQCLPFYNQQPFRQGESCEECNCFDHATVCEYDAVVDANSQSLNVAGEYSGGGVCIDCQNNTAGNNCEKCKLKFYRPEGRLQTSENACVSCNCSVAGSVVNPVTEVLGDCVMNSETAVPPGVIMSPGDCFCKDNVQGTKCEECKPGFYNLQTSNILGCESCECNTAGTVAGSTVCTPDSEGQCQCKDFVINRRCDECEDQYYGLSSENINGCSACDCNTGGSLDNVCNKTNGQCNCQPNVGGRQCTDPAEGNFFPDLHFISTEAEEGITNVDLEYKDIQGFSGLGYVNIAANEEVSMNIQFPGGTTLSGEVTFVVRYRAAEDTTLTFAVTPLAGSSSVTLQLPACTETWCHVNTPATYTLEKENRIYTLELTPSASISLDKVVALPVEFTDTSTVLGEDAPVFESICDVIQDDMKIGTENEGLCLISVFTLTSHYLDGTMPCDCHPQGSYTNETCAKYGGQCRCKPGAGGRQCDVCKPEYFDLTETGCKECNCMASDKVCNTATGQCNCPPNVRGEQCEQCLTDHWNWHETNGCQPCDCDTIGSSSQQCNLTTGVCPCKPGVGGEKCDACLDGFTGLNILTGCQACNCDLDGSVSHICDPANGQCPCKENTQGQYCDTCQLSTFYNDASHAQGCLDCICMGISSACSSTTTPLSIVTVPLVNISDNSPAFYLSTATERLTTLFPTVITVNGTDVLVVELGIQSSVYWVPSDGIRNNLLPMYGNNLSFTIQWTSLDESGVEETEHNIIFVGRDSVVYRLPFPAVPKDVITQVDIKMTEVGALNASGGEVTRAEMIRALSNVENILIPATLYSRSHTVMLYSVSYGIAAEGGTAGSSPAVEQCACGIQYQGQSCEECAYGYKRDQVESHEYLGVCVACDCNNHADDCDADTGICIDCLHNTAGDHCELCAPGYYGDATRGLITDCVACPCFDPRVLNSTCAIVEGEPVCQFCAPGYTGDQCDTCEEFYYGNPEIVFVGTCERCDCNGNSETCDTVTGECVNCSNNSTGFNCERCKDEWFGNSSAQACQPCECDLNGTDSVVCNHTTGQCECYPGVGERICNQCQPNFYGYNNDSIFGCTDCECNPGGSADLQCDESGVCTCNEVSGGTKCDFCAEGYYGLPYKPCELCDCDATGTVDASQICERIFGQCECKPGVDSRKCDTCQRLYKDFSDTGCTQCEVCQYSLGNDTLLMKQNWETYWNETKQVEAVQEQDSLLQILSKEINSTSSLLGLSEDRLNVLTSSVEELQSNVPAYIQTVTDFVAEVNEMETRAVEQSITTSEEEERIAGLLEVTNTASQNVMQLNTTTHSYLGILTGYVTSAEELLRVSITSTPAEVNVTFDGELENTRTELELVQETAERAQTMVTSVDEQGKDIDALINATRDAQERVDSLLPKLSEVESHIGGIHEVLTQAWQIVNSSIANRDYTVRLLNETQVSVTYLTELLAENQALYAEGSMLFNESKLVIEGLSTGVPPPINTTLDLNGIDSFNQGADYLKNVLIPPLNLSLYNLSNIDLPRIRTKVQLLMNEAETITQVFNSVSPLAKQATDAIHDYEAVITVLEEAKALALEANVTMMEVLSALDDVSEEDLQNSAQNLALSAASLQIEAATFDGKGAALSLQLDSLESDLDVITDRWTRVSTRIDAFTTAAEELDALTQSSTFSDNIASANAIASEVLSYNTPLEPLVEQVTSLEQRLSDIQEQVNNASQAEVQIENQLRTFQTRLDEDIQRSVDLTSQDYTESLSIRNRIDNSIGGIEAKVEQAMSMLAEMEQPVSFNAQDYAELVNPLVDESHFYNEVAFTFKYDLDPVGVLFLAENNVTGERLLIQLLEERVVFQFANIDTTMRAVSPADLCSGCWFRVIATRYGIDGQLTVTKMSTGGTAVTHVRGESTRHNILILNSPVYIAGLPANYDFDAGGSNSGFEGCIYSATFNGNIIPVWQKILHHSSTATCCSPPPSLPTPATISATSFDNFGSYLRLSLPSLPIATSSHIAIELRTFSPNAVVFLADMNGFTGYYGMLIQEGRLTLAASGGGESFILRTDQSYNDGSWHRVSVQMNVSNALLHLETHNGTEWVTTEVKSEAHSVDLSALTAPQYTIGGQNPDTSEISGPVTESFAGCIQSFQHNTGEDLTLTPVTLSSVVLRSFGVNLDSCYMDVVSGIGLSEPQGYVALNDIPNPLTYLEFDLLTFEPHGILMFAELSTDPPATFLYIALYHGDILVLFNQGSGIQPALTTRGLYLSDGQSHTVTLDCRFPNSLRLGVRGQRHYGALTMSPGMNLRSSRLYVGGVPPGITLNELDLPVLHGIVGGIRNIKVNTNLIDYFASMDDELHEAAYLSGIPAPADNPPPPPYPTPSPGPSTVAPTCAPNKVFSMSEEGIRFGNEPVSYLALNVENFKHMFQGSFVIRIKFRALQPSGILFYIASGTVNAQSYFTIYLDEGFLVLSVQTNTTASQEGSTKLIKSKMSHYGNGRFWDVVVLRLNDFLALTVPTEEYGNNGNLASSEIPSSLQLTDTLFIGGVSSQHAGFPFSSNQDISIGSASFHGCIQSVIISSHDIDEREIDLSAPLDAAGVSQCYDEVNPGVFLNATNAYVRVMSDVSPTFDIQPGFNVTISFRSAQVNGTLLLAYMDQSRFFMVDMLEGQICILIGNTMVEAAPLIAKSHILDVGYGLCNGDLHSLSIVLEDGSLLFNFDSVGWERIGYPQNFATPSLTSIALYTGGIKNADWTFPVPTSMASFHGCIQDLNIKGRAFNLVTSTDKKAVVVGCPSE